MHGRAVRNTGSRLEPVEITGSGREAVSEEEETVTINADVMVIETRATDTINSYGGPSRLSAVEVRAVPFNSNNLVREISFVMREDDAPRVGAVLKVTVEEEKS